MNNPLASFSNRDVLVAPSLLAADFARLGEQIKEVADAGADMLHLDIMDGHFVPNLTFGPPLVASIKHCSQLLLDAHLMLTHPLQYVAPFAKAGAQSITFHIECEQDPAAVIAAIRHAGCAVGISVRPKTPAEAILPWIQFVDLILVMSVEPGFGGQSFMADMMPKTRTLRNAINSTGRNIQLQIDGGIDSHTVHVAANAGANLMVAGTSVFRHPQGMRTAIQALKAAKVVVD